MCENLLDDWRKEDELWATRTPNWRELMKKLQHAEENLASLGGASSPAFQPADMSSANGSSRLSNHVRERSFHQASSSLSPSSVRLGAFGVTPDELLR